MLGFMRRKVHAVRGVSFSVQPGEVLGFVGPNGAGKTTTVKCALELIHPTRGDVHLFGKPSGDRKSRARLGYLPENPYIYSYLKPMEFLDLCGQLCGMPSKARRERAEMLLQRLSLSHAASRPVGKFSKGMMQRLGMCQTLLHDPELLVLDEPFSGLDPIGRKDIRDLLHEEHSAGKTIVIISHVLSDVEQICDRVVIVNYGRVTAEGRIDELLAGDVRRVEIELAQASEDLLTKLRADALELRQLKETVVVVVEGQEASTAVLSQVGAAGAQVVAVTPHRETLEDLFVRNALASGQDDR